jgi:oxalate decarboxylase/phosphoglucose isomerase-like protein (cupin superfamily)
MAPLTNLVLSLLAASAVTALPASNTFPQLIPRAGETTAPTGSPPPSPAPAGSKAPAPVDPALLVSLSQAPTQVDRFKTLLAGGKENIVFDFTKSAPPAGKGGNVVLANKKNYPAVMDLGISAAVGTLDPCGMNTAHTHPRASEFLIVVEGQIESGFVLENGFTAEVDTVLPKYSGTVFPQGSIHFQFNPTCEKAVFVAALSSDDPGASQIAQNFFGLREDVVQATLGFPESLAGEDIEKFKNTIPANVALGIESCLAKCGIPKK